ncbi:site-specific DNA-methyltransferase [Ancylobacter sp. FA202]|uniref:DNA-methyltransferase n=1 Tax=Ancylobacter sp. FA202 TaxID=1111106 RepID=UPI003526E8CE
MEIIAGLSINSVGSILTDPPYSSANSLRCSRDVLTSRKYSFRPGKYPEFDGDCRDQRSYLAWSNLWLTKARAKVISSGICCVFSDWRQLPTTTDAIQAAGWVWRGIVPWDKTECARPQRGRYRNQAEYVVWATNGRRPLAGPTAPGVIRCRPPVHRLHMAGKPVDLMSNLLQIMEGPILDPFMGSGSVGVACISIGLPYIVIESNKDYFELSCERLASFYNFNK